MGVGVCSGDNVCFCVANSSLNSIVNSVFKFFFSSIFNYSLNSMIFALGFIL